MVKGNFKELAEQRESVNELLTSSLRIDYFFWVDERMVEGETCEVFNYAILSPSLPDGGVWYWSALPKLPVELSAEKESIVKEGIELALSLCIGAAAAEFDSHLPQIAFMVMNGRMKLKLSGIMDGSPEGRAQREAVSQEVRACARGLVKEMGDIVRDHVLEVMEADYWHNFDVSFNDLKETHDALKPLWSEAKKLITQARRSQVRRPSRRDEIRSFFARHGFKHVDTDLIIRLDSPSEWSEDLASKLQKHGAEGKPYDIALEHAARLCGFPGYADYSLTISSLKKKLKNG